MALVHKVVSGLCLYLAICVVTSSVIFRKAGRKSLAERTLRYEDDVIMAEGSLGPDDVLYIRDVMDAEPHIDDCVYQDALFVRYPGNITYIHIYEQGESQNASATVLEGGLGTNHVTLRLMASINRGYNVSISIYGEENVPPPSKVQMMKLLTEKKS